MFVFLPSESGHRGNHGTGNLGGDRRSDRYGGGCGRERREGNGAADAALKTVYVVDETGGLRAQPVELGISDGTWTEVVGSGPREGDWIATGIQTAAEKEKSEKSGSSSPFMPRRPRGSSGGPPPPM